MHYDGRLHHVSDVYNGLEAATQVVGVEQYVDVCLKALAGDGLQRRADQYHALQPAGSTHIYIIQGAEKHTLVCSSANGIRS